jgi:dipeptidyl aminopeptidase/acylaminoacyl peptidase
MFKIFQTLVAATVAAAGLVAAPAPAQAAEHASGPTFAKLVAYVRDGNVHVSKGATERRLTTGGGHSRVRWSPDGRKLAFLRGGLLWVMNADGSGKRRLTTRPASGPAWSPDGRWIAFASAGCVGGPAVYRISATAANAQPAALFPASCREQAPPVVTAAPAAPTGTLAQRLRRDDALAWSPDGARIAFRGGDCEAIYDDCLSLGNVATGGERVLAAYGGGGSERSGFAVVPAFRRDGAKVTWTAYREGENAASTLPVHVVEHDLASGRQRRIGAAEDREMVYESATRGVVTGRHQGASWLIVVNLVTGARAPFHKGSQASIQP